MEEAAGWAGRWVGEEKSAVNGDNKGEARDAEDEETSYSPPTPEDQLARGERSDALKLSLLCFCLCAPSAVSSSLLSLLLCKCGSVSQLVRGPGS